MCIFQNTAIQLPRSHWKCDSNNKQTQQRKAGKHCIITMTYAVLCQFPYKFYSSFALFLDLDVFETILQAIVLFPWNELIYKFQVIYLIFFYQLSWLFVESNSPAHHPGQNLTRWRRRCLSVFLCHLTPESHIWRMYLCQYIPCPLFCKGSVLEPPAIP